MQAAGARRRGHWGAQAWALGRAGVGAGGAGERACGRRWACVGARAGARAQGAAAGGARARLGERQQREGRAGDGRQARGQACRGRAGAHGWEHGARGARPAWAWPGRWMGAQVGPAGPVLVHYAPGSVLARFFDPVRLGIFLESPNEHCSL